MLLTIMLFQTCITRTYHLYYKERGCNTNNHNFCRISLRCSVVADVIRCSWLCRLLLFHVMPHITHSEFLLEQLKRQRERSFLCDCTVVIGQSQYNAHYNVLAAFSEYFSTQSIDAGKENATITLDPELVSGAVFEKLLTYIYTGDLSMDRWVHGKIILYVYCYLYVVLSMFICTVPDIFKTWKYFFIYNFSIQIILTPEKAM